MILLSDIFANPCAIATRGYPSLIQGNFFAYFNKNNELSNLHLHYLNNNLFHIISSRLL